MKTFRLIFLSLAIISLFAHESAAQRDVNNWQISPYGGLLTLNNDVAVPENSNSYAFGLRLDRRLWSDFTLGLHMTQLAIDDVSQSNLTGGFLSLGYHWDNGYLLSKRAGFSIFHRLEAGYMDRYSTFESINQKSADLAFGFENGIKLRFGDRISADLALEILGSKSSLTNGDITENIRYNVWKFGLTYHFGSRKSDYMAPIFVPYAGIPNISKLEKVDKKADNIWIANDSIHSKKLKGFTRNTLLIDTAKQKVSTPKSLTRADSLLIFMYFDSLYQRRTDTSRVKTVRDTSQIGRVVPVAIADSSLAKADSIAINETALRDSTFKDKSDTTQVLDVVNLDSDTLSERKSMSDTLSTRMDSAKTQKADSVNMKSNITVTELDTSAAPVDTGKTQKPKSLEIKSDTANTAISNQIKTDTTTVQPKYKENKSDTTKTVVPKSNIKSDTLKTSSKVEKSDSLRSEVNEAKLKAENETEAEKARASSEAARQKNENDERAAVAAAAVAAANAKKDSIVTRVDTVYVDKEVQQTQPAEAEQTGKDQTEKAKVDTVFIDKELEKNANGVKDDKEKKIKDSQDNKKQESLKENSSDKTKNDKSDNSADYQKSLERQNDLLEKQNKQIADNQKEIARLRKKNKLGDTGKILVAGAAGTALGAAINSGSKNNTDTVYFESAKSEQILDSLQRELAMLKAKYEPDLLNAADSAYVPYPPIGQYFANDSIVGDSVSRGIEVDTTYVARTDSAFFEPGDTLSVPPKLEVEKEITQPEVTPVVSEPPVESPKSNPPVEKQDKSESENKEKPENETSENSTSGVAIKGAYPISCNFGLNQTNLNQEELNKLDVVISDLRNSNREVLLTGFTDKSGNADYNLRLSKKRAESVKAYLVEKKITADKIEVQGGGIDDGADKFAPSARRVEVSLK